MKMLMIVCLGAIISSCGGGGGGDSISPSVSTSFTISGTVPGTIIEAYGDNGSYYKVSSDNDGSGMHPFSLTLKSGVKYSLFMTVNENTTQTITTPIYFDNNGTPTSSFTSSANQTINFGHLPLYTTKTDAVNAGKDNDNDGVLDDGQYHLVNTISGLTLNNLVGTYTWDVDGDGKHNYYDDDYIRGANTSDSDDDGIEDSIDINPNNIANSNSFSLSYYDLDDDGYFDNDRDRDGYLDSSYDYDNDGDYDDNDHNYYYGGSNAYGEVEGRITAINGSMITIYAYEIERLNLTSRVVVIDTSNAYFEHTSLANLALNMMIEAKGSFNTVTNTLNAYKVEREY
jgi:hypothetical protein